MSKQMNKTTVLKNAFLILMILDLIDLVMSCIALIPSVKMLPEYGQIMMAVAGTITAAVVAVLLFEVFAKFFLVRNLFSGRKSCAVLAKLLFLLNLCAVLINILAIGGEGATLMNQGRLYLHILASVVEMIVVVAYLRAAKKSSIEK